MQIYCKNSSLEFYNLSGNCLAIIFATLLIALKKPNFPHVRMQSMISNDPKTRASYAE